MDLRRHTLLIFVLCWAQFPPALGGAVTNFTECVDEGNHVLLDMPVRWGFQNAIAVKLLHYLHARSISIIKNTMKVFTLTTIIATAWARYNNELNIIIFNSRSAALMLKPWGCTSVTSSRCTAGRTSFKQSPNVKVRRPRNACPLPLRIEHNCV